MGHVKKTSAMGGRGRGGGRGGGGEDPMHAAARSGDLSAVQSMCCSNPLSVNSRDRHSRTPLHLAAWAGHAEVVSFLCQNKADVGAAAMDDMGAIHFASQKGHLEVVRTLVNSGVSIKATNRKGFTPLHYSALGSHMGLVKYLVKKGASLTVKTKAGKTPIDLAENDEVRLFLEESEKSTEKNGALNSSEKGHSELAESQTANEEDTHRDHASRTLHESDQHQTQSAKEEDIDREQGTIVDGKEENKEGEKRKKGEENETKNSSSSAKRPRIALGHLQAGNDMQEDEEE